jgi:serine/threonine protein kinase/tetratricopeptide (TPR) repeat protein
MAPSCPDPSTSVSSLLADDSGVAEPIFPEAGDSFGDFQLLAELGRGGQGCVFLATQRFLADRPVVLKISACDGGEHLSLARLQHTHIVPLYYAADDRARNLRLLCMPYFGNATLRQALDFLKPLPFSRRTGRDVVQAIDKSQDCSPITLPSGGPARQMLSRLTYIQSVCWIGVCLAEALNYAHERGLMHLDIKPSNVLLAVDGQPMLLDFHLAQPPIQPGGAPPDWLGGSPLYMSPEHKVTLNAVRRDEMLPVSVDGRADIYSLGALLYEALGGTLPFRHDTSPALHQVNSAVSVGLSDIIHKSLSADAATRYSTAAGLAGDLQRHLAHRPLRGVRNRSLTERWWKWRRRRPYALAVIGLGIAVFIACAGLILLQQQGHKHLRRQLQTLIASGHEELAQGRSDAAAHTARHGLALAAGIAATNEAVAELQILLRRAERAQITRDLTTMTDRLRSLYGMDSLPDGELRALELQCRTFWDNRRLILEKLESELDAEASPVRTDLLDLALLWTDIQVQLAPPAGAAGARREAMRTLEQAEAALGDSPVLASQRQQYAEALGDPEIAVVATRGPQTAWEHYALGRMALKAGALETAATSFDHACSLQPQGFWPHYYQGVCAYRQKNYAQSLAAFSVCVGVNASNAVCFYNRALAFSALHQHDLALADYDRSLILDPRLAAAALNRGLLYYRQEHYLKSAADLRRALELGANPATVYYNLALIRLAQSDQRGASECLNEALRHDPYHRDALQLRQTLDRRYKR